ncbi:putative golgi membrane [Phaeomoniella chlamydospora]|uniref:Putative golgi membrane n=1 Tax=Phaeomoniella chlamydospora TaxID=158046 RepID=A0A0G2EBU7_PHACM|nr:putative golgi membrane [Phaeomoniella chlamydospora]
MAQYYQPQYPQSSSAQNLQFYPSSYGAPVSGHTTPSQASYGGYGNAAGNSAGAYPGYGGVAAFGGAAAAVSGRMGEQGGLRTGWLAAFGTEGYDGEPPLLEELGVNFEHIRTKTLTVLNPLTRPSPHIMDDSDLYGALLFLILYGTFLALSGKFFYGYIYGIALFGSLALHLIFSLMTPIEADQMTSSSNPVEVDPTTMNHGHVPGVGIDTTSSISSGHGGHFSSTLTYSRSASVLGYCFLPLTFTALFGILVPMDTLLGYILTSLAVAWCTFSSSGIFVSVGRKACPIQALIGWIIGDLFGVIGLTV